MVFCFVQLFLQVQSQEIISYHEAIIPGVPRSHRASVCRSAALGVSGLAEGSSPSEFTDAIDDDRKIEVIRIK
jgi:hypothetical protein